MTQSMGQSTSGTWAADAVLATADVSLAAATVRTAADIAVRSVSKATKFR